MPSRENLTFIGSEELVISTASVGITAALITKAVSYGRITPTIGDIYIRLSGGDANADGNNGEEHVVLDGEFEVWGHDNITNLRMLKKTGETDAPTGINLYGDGGNN